MMTWAWVAVGVLLGCQGGGGTGTPPALEACTVTASSLDRSTPAEGMAWVYQVDLVGGGTPTCPSPEADAAEWQVGFLFDVTPDDCPTTRDKDACDAQSESDRYPRTVRMYNAATALPITDVAGLTLPERLARYCVYHRPGSDAAPAFNDSTNTNPVQARAVVDVAATQAEIDDVIQAVSAQHVGFCPVSSAGGVAPVRLTFIDNAPTGAGGGPSRHGASLQSIVSGLCSDGECDVDVRQRAGLQLRWEGQHEWKVREGGDYGSLDWLAQSIVREVESWLDDPVRSDRLVLNLSMAWHGEWGGADPRQAAARETPADVMAVFDAIVYARCSGALVVAAAGNRTGCGFDDAPMYPAAWEAVRIGPNQCGPWLLERFYPQDDVPLVYAVGGLVEQDAPIAIGRDGNTPHLAAYARNVSVPASGETITGTSVASALVAADVARRWSANSTLTADDAMAAVYRAGTPTGLAVEGAHYLSQGEFFDDILGAPESSEVRRVASCGVGPAPRRLTWPEACPGPACELLSAFSGAAYPFGFVQPGRNLEPFANPTPTTDPCELCGFDVVPRRLAVRLAPQFTDPVAAVAAVKSGSGGWTMWEVALPGGGGLEEVQLDGAPCDATRAALMFDYDGEGYIAEVQVIGAPACGPGAP